MESTVGVSKLRVLWVVFMGLIFAPAVYGTQFIQGRAFTPEGLAIINGMLDEALPHFITGPVFNAWSYLIYLVCSALPEGTKYIYFALKFITMYDGLVFLVIAATAMVIRPPSRLPFMRKKSPT